MKSFCAWQLCFFCQTSLIEKEKKKDFNNFKEVSALSHENLTRLGGYIVPIVLVPCKWPPKLMHTHRGDYINSVRLTSAEVKGKNTHTDDGHSFKFTCRAPPPPIQYRPYPHTPVWNRVSLGFTLE